MFDDVAKVEELTIIFRLNGNAVLRQWGDYATDNRIELTRSQRALAAELLGDYRAGQVADVEINLGAVEGVRDSLLHLHANGQVLITQIDCLGNVHVVTDSVDLMADWASVDSPSVWDVVEQHR